MKRSGFTMIELIFVIVILGILASVAIPKLAATRDDAKVSKALSELATLKSDLSSYYTSQGTYAAGAITSVTNIPLYTANTCASTAKAAGITVASVASAAGATLYYCTEKSGGGLEDAMKITLKDTGGVLTFATGSGNGNIASAVKTAATKNGIQGTVSNGGSKVKF